MYYSPKLIVDSGGGTECTNPPKSIVSESESEVSEVNLSEVKVKVMLFWSFIFLETYKL